MDMGLTPGTTVCVEGTAPLGILSSCAYAGAASACAEAKLQTYQSCPAPGKPCAAVCIPEAPGRFGWRQRHKQGEFPGEKRAGAGQATTSPRRKDAPHRRIG